MKRITKIMALSLVLCMMFSTVAFAAENEDVLTTSEESPFEVMIDGSAKPSAPPLTDFYVWGVQSSDHPTIEQIQYTSSFFPVSTTENHGGTWLKVYVVEVGYAGQRFAYFNNSLMSLNNTYPLDFDGDNIIDGYICEWLYQGNFTNGTFKANSKSTNYPWNTMYISSFNIL